MSGKSEVYVGWHVTTTIFFILCACMGCRPSVREAAYFSRQDGGGEGSQSAGLESACTVSRALTECYMYT